MMPPEHKFRLLQRWRDGDLSKDAVCQRLGITPTTLQALDTVWGERLPRLVPLIDQLLQEHRTKREQTAIKKAIARYLKVTYRQVNRLLQESEITVPTPISSKIRQNLRENAEKRRNIVEKAAIRVISGEKGVEDAANDVSLSVRQMYRQVRKQLASLNTDLTHLHDMQLERRRKIAKTLEQRHAA